MSKPSASWDRIGDRFYRKVPLYTDVFDPELELENYLVCGAPYGGALALHRDQSRIQAFRNADALKSTIDIYSCAGKLIKQLNWDKGRIVGLGWSDEEVLVVVTQDGAVRCFHDLSDDFTPFSLGTIAEEHGVVSCRFWLSGFAALLGNNQVVAVPRYDDPRPKVLATPPPGEVASWTIIPPAYSLSRSVEVLLAIGQTINVVDASDSEDRMLQNGPFRHVCVSPNGRFVALYTDDGKVWVVSSDFQEKLSEYDTRARTVPRDVQWCGNDAVVLAWEDEVHLLGPNGSSAKYYFDAWVHLMPDVDGVRLFTNDVCEFLQKVPDATEDVFRIGSQSPAAILLDAADQLDRKSPKADDNIQLIRPRLADAVDGCIAAAGNEYGSHWQKQLLKAASFGKTVLDSYDSDEFVGMCETVRVLNAVRFFAVGMPLSHEQYTRLNPDRLVQRLANREHYPLALRLAEHLRVPSARVHVHWARRKVRAAAADDDAACAQIVARLAHQPGIPWAAVARAAHADGRARLATGLLEHERRAGPRVRLLQDMHEHALALDAALASGDTDLALAVLQALHRALPLAAFFRTLGARPVAAALVEATARARDDDLLRDLYYQDDRRLDGALLLLRRALAEPSAAQTLEALRPAAKLLHDAKELAPAARMLDDAARLLRLQAALDADEALAADAGARFTGLTLNATVAALVRAGAGKRAQQAMADFRVPERTQWWLRLRAHVAGRQWRELEALAAATRRCPIGWAAFARAALDAGNPRLAGNTFVPKCAGLAPRERMDLYVKCDMLARAGEEAVRAKDRAWLEEMRDKTGGRERVEMERLLGMLAKGR